MLLDDVHWRFGWKRYAHFESFNRDVLTHNNEISPRNHGWEPDRVVASGPVKVQFEIVWKEEGEDLIEFEISKIVEPLTMGELLFRLNNLSFEFFRDVHSVYLEGIEIINDSTLWLDTGS